VTISYSDGAEDVVYALLCESKDLSSTSLIGLHCYDDWAIRYHLCPERSNLLRHLDFSNLSVLELGAGMGATSRYIAENARRFVAVEGTESRSRALRERLRDLNNWESFTCNIEDFQTDERFDVVCMIGVLEYAGVYIHPESGSNPYLWLLEHAVKLLRPGGQLILAIENRNGLKYWAGAPEDHTSRMFDGICGYTHSPAPRTFSRKVLLDLLQSASLSSVKEFYPWPDYKIPYAVIGKQLVDSHPLFAAEVAGDATAREIDKSNRFFPESIALIEAARSGLFADLSNSFLFVCGKENHSPIRSSLLHRTLSHNEIAWHYTVSRKIPSFTSFLSEDHENALRSQKQPMNPMSVGEVEEGYQMVRWNPGRTSNVKLETSVLQTMRKLAYAGDLDAFVEELKRFLRWALDVYEYDEHHVNTDAFDLTPSNTVPRGSDYEVFDQEWETIDPLDKSWFVMRNVLAVDDALRMFTQAPWRKIGDLYETLCTSLGIVPNLKEDMAREVRVQADVHRHVDGASFSGALERHFLEPCPQAVFPRNADAVQKMHQVLLREKLTLSGVKQLVQLAPSFQSIAKNRWVRGVFKLVTIVKKPTSLRRQTRGPKNRR
jgi:SAM-dependent methyltransferase